jgi:hypothetical protein
MVDRLAWARRSCGWVGGLVVGTVVGVRGHRIGTSRRRRAREDLFDESLSFAVTTTPGGEVKLLLPLCCLKTILGPVKSPSDGLLGRQGSALEVLSLARQSRRCQGRRWEMSVVLGT